MSDHQDRQPTGKVGGAMSGIVRHAYFLFRGLIFTFMAGAQSLASSP
ncbi:hypothetical protein AB0N16_21770 [Streptomyces sp. NPDC051105]